jgi:hypothetical protein
MGDDLPPIANASNGPAVMPTSMSHAMTTAKRSRGLSRLRSRHAAEDGSAGIRGIDPAELLPVGMARGLGREGKQA